jgi:hypothetical protein
MMWPQLRPRPARDALCQRLRLDLQRRPRPARTPLPRAGRDRIAAHPRGAWRADTPHRPSYALPRSLHDACVPLAAQPSVRVAGWSQALVGELSTVWSGSCLPTPPETLSPIACDGCRRQMHLDETVFALSSRNVDYCAACYDALPPQSKSGLVEQYVYQRCGVEAPAKAASELSSFIVRDLRVWGGLGGGVHTVRRSILGWRLPPCRYVQEVWIAGTEPPGRISDECEVAAGLAPRPSGARRGRAKYGFTVQVPSACVLCAVRF